MSALDGGSAAPPTADVPMWVLSLRVPERLRGRVQRAAALRGMDTSTYIRSLLAGATATLDLDRTVTCSAPLRELEIGGALDHSGVAGEPEATPKEASETAVAVSPTPTHAPTPETPGASTTAGGVTVPDEAVEALVRHLSEETLPAAWRTDDRWERCKGGAVEAWGPRARAYLALTAPLIAAQALTSTHDRIRAIAERLEAKGRAAGGNKLHLGTAAGVRLALVKLVEIADELERGGDRG